MCCICMNLKPGFSRGGHVWSANHPWANTREKKQKMEKGCYPGSRITPLLHSLMLKSKTSSPNKPWAHVLFPRAVDLDPVRRRAQTHSLCPPITISAVEARADKSWWMQIVCGVTDSFVYSGMVSWWGAAPCSPSSERKKREDGSKGK